MSSFHPPPFRAFGQMLFGKFGTLTVFFILPSDNPTRHRGHGFAEFATAESAATAVEFLDKFSMGGREMFVVRCDDIRSAIPPWGLLFPLRCALVVF